MQKTIYGLGMGLCMLLWSGEVGASLYCAVDFNGRRCQFVDLESCQKAVGGQGSCVLNRDGLVAPQGGAPFCLTEQWQTECIYRDREACEKVAAPRKATCIANPNLNRSREGAPVSGGTPTGTPQGEDASKNRNYLPSPDYFPSPGHR
ncbi:MAG: hypothetical protein HW380_2604 [Magnetococcales bacterium]|nr:hypothetical protein [Magnetococcales bacterium]